MSSSTLTQASVVTTTTSIFPLPVYILQDIFNMLEDAKYIAKARGACKDFLEASRWIRSLRIVCLNEYHEALRDQISTETLTAETAKFGLKQSEGESSAPVSEDEPPPHPDLGGDEPAAKKQKSLNFRDIVVDILKDKYNLVQLRIEVEPKLQSKTVPEAERKRTDHWLSDPAQLNKWIPYVHITLQHLCIVDYGQQAIMRRTNIMKILSQTCHMLKTLDLRNMFIDTNDCGNMLSMISMTLRCVKVNGEALQDINDHMPNLQTLALLGVFGITQAKLTFLDMKVLCLGLSTTAKEVTVNLPKLSKLQLKMHCPETLRINAVNLKFVAFNLEVQESSIVELWNIIGLQELLYGTSSFVTLTRLLRNNPNIEKLFLDIPCMALGEDGRWLGVLKDVPINLPSFSILQECGKLSVWNVGPGLWYSMEVNVEVLTAVPKWPPVRRLILHMIPQQLHTCKTILRILLKLPLNSLEIYVHINSPVDLEDIVLNVEEMKTEFGQDFSFKPSSWTKSLDFSCFSF